VEVKALILILVMVLLTTTSLALAAAEDYYEYEKRRRLYETTLGSLEITIEEMAVVTQLYTPVPVRVSLVNTGRNLVTATLELVEPAETMMVASSKIVDFTIGPAEQKSYTFNVAFRDGTLVAQYPVKIAVRAVEAGKEWTVTLARLGQVNTTDDARHQEAPTIGALAVPAKGVLPLWKTKEYRPAWQQLGGSIQYKSVGWQGTDSLSGAVVSFDDASLEMVPAWRQRVGSVYVEYLVQLPEERAWLTFSNKIADPRSDGVWFRVWVADPTSGEFQRIYEKFTDAQYPVPGEVDLTPYAGQTILLRLECHPGPFLNAARDTGYWLEPMIVAREQISPQMSMQDVASRNQLLGKALLAGEVLPDQKYTFLLGEGEQAIVVVLHPTERGIIDGVLSFVGSESSLSCAGFALRVNGIPVLSWPEAVEFVDYEVVEQDGRFVHLHTVRLNGELIDVGLALWMDGPGLRVAFTSSGNLTDWALGEFDQRAPVLYFGHGYRVVEPGAFQLGVNGHSLSTSHGGFEFTGGMSLLQAVDNVPEYLEVIPETNRYTLHSALPGTMTLVPSEQGAFAAAIGYQRLYDKEASPGVERLAGRFSFDIWQGRYQTIADQMAKMLAYGLDDSFLVIHNWQHMGFDRKLPDIWPPNPVLGTIDELKAVGDLCAEAGIFWGLHDNYMDFYPEADRFSYELVARDSTGQPLVGSNYWWIPGAYKDRMESNLEAIKAGVAPSMYFLDIFAAEAPFDYYDPAGEYHSRLETRQQWGETFAWIGAFLDGVTTSEAGHDQLIGYLDGADAQWLRINSDQNRPSKPYTFYLPCEDWERVPWFDAVNHHRFVLYGAGYPYRYDPLGRGGLGVHTDDYISSEILAGHSLMVDYLSWELPAVRKYWLAQPVARNLALQTMTRWEMYQGDPGRQIVEWSNGTTVYVNRSGEDWPIAGHVLPQYGFLVVGDGLQATVERIDGLVVESTIMPEYWYANARNVLMGGPEPRIENFDYFGGRTFMWDIVWDGEPVVRDMIGFIHFYNGDDVYYPNIAFQQSYKAGVSFSREIRSFTVPESASGKYTVGIGRIDLDGHLPLRGPREVKIVGTLEVIRSGDTIVDIRFTPSDDPAPSTNGGAMVDFGFCRTDGGFRLEPLGDNLKLTPLPDHPPFSVELDLQVLGIDGAYPTGIRGYRLDTEESYPVEFNVEGSTVSFGHDGRAHWYEIHLERR